MTDERYMKQALKEARKAAERGDIPVGCVIVKEEKIVSRGRNEILKKKDPTAHAEINAIRKAAKKLGYERLTDCRLYVTLEPCSMCAGAIVLARVPYLIYGTADPKTGACGSIYDIVRNEKLNHKVDVVSGIMEQECSQILKQFFAELRNRK